MRKMQKQQIADIMESLRQAHLEIAELIMRADYATVQAALADCQECMIEVGNAIEGSEGEDCEAVRKAQEYCEAVFGLYQAVGEQATKQNVSEQAIAQTTQTLNAQGQNVMGRYIDLHKCMQQALQAVCDAVEALPVKREIAFFPYKASMWDSLESIYLAAKADESCEAYCVPIPYFDKNPDGSFKEMYYEGADYPSDIEVIDWQSYRFEECKPDVIYIHNPYDNMNHVTSVHPRFYAENLKKYTEELIYVPYFVLEEIEPNDQVKIDAMKHFCVVPGTVYADKVILQSENMAQIYINEYAKAIEAAGGTADREKLAKKFLGLGSPKFDKVVNTKKENLDIPEEWLKIIEKSDGSWKKIIFYNTSVTALLEHNERMLQKMRYVFGVFKDWQEDVALLWRPHPLIQSTIESMRPQLWAEYKAIVEEYKAEGWGIYDDTPDMDRAVVLSDAYYGDRSSIVQLYQKTGKPVMVQNVDVQEKRECLLLSAYTFVNIDNGIYFASKNVPGFFRYDKKNEKLGLIPIKLKRNDMVDRFLFGGMHVYQDRIVLAPYFSTEIRMYDIQNLKKVENMDISSLLLNYGQKYPFVKRIISYDNLLYFVGGVHSEMLCLNMETKKVYVVDTWRKAARDVLEETECVGINTGGDMCIIENVMWVPLKAVSCVLEFDLRTQNANVHKLDNIEMIFVTICFDGESFWLTGEAQKIVKWNPKTSQVGVLEKFPNNFIQFRKEGYPWKELFTRSFIEGKYIFLFPMTANMVLRVCVEDGRIEKIYEWSEVASCYTVEKWDEENFYIEVGNTDFIEINESIIMDKNGNVKQKDIFQCKTEKLKGVVYEDAVEMYSENKVIDLEDYCVTLIGV